ncbi:hypothetical protein [Sphingomonas sp.]|nr:hypothetical protein [Sphingomonas sp.]MBX3592983.1 hypothetical protein [Sphingomonas sp.]
MIDNLILGLTHGLLVVTALRLVNSPRLDDESAPVDDADTPRRRWGRPRA